MRRHIGRAGVVLALVSLFVIIVGIAFASDPPDSKVNPQSGFIETVDSVQVGSSWEIRHTLTPPQGPQLVTLLSSSTLEDRDPRLAVSPAGDVWVTWWRDAAADQVLVRKRSVATGTWTTEWTVSDSSEASRRPQIAHHASQAWVAFVVPCGGSAAIAVTGGDGPDPWPSRTIVGTTTYAGDLDPTISAESSHLWITWVDSGSTVAWTQYDDATEAWSTVQSESYASDSVPAARERIRTEVFE
jgi:hypothetical protein